MNEKELLANGINVSNLHTDFMIGSPDVDVTGLTWDGKKVNIIIDGEFVGDFEDNENEKFYRQVKSHVAPSLLKEDSVVTLRKLRGYQE